MWSLDIRKFFPLRYSMSIISLALLSTLFSTLVLIPTTTVGKELIAEKAAWCRSFCSEPNLSIKEPICWWRRTSPICAEGGQMVPVPRNNDDYIFKAKTNQVELTRFFKECEENGWLPLRTNKDLKKYTHVDAFSSICGGNLEGCAQPACIMVRENPVPSTNTEKPQCNDGATEKEICPRSGSCAVFARHPIMWGDGPGKTGSLPDKLNLQAAHEHIFFCENGHIVDNTGFMPGPGIGVVGRGDRFSYTQEDLTCGMEKNGHRVDDFRPIDNRCFDPTTLRIALEVMRVRYGDGPYTVVVNNCQGFTERARVMYFITDKLGEYVKDKQAKDKQAKAKDKQAKDQQSKDQQSKDQQSKEALEKYIYPVIDQECRK